MPIDQYSPCPCGSGKKMKFCKCVEQPQEYEKLVRLMEGGQELAAMDRINQMLAKTPNAAWLLALKGELALGMNEVETFKETADRFLKLKPDNPLALIMKSLACAFDQQPVENIASYMLQGLSETRESLPALALMAIELLIRSLAANGKLSLSGYWCDLQNVLMRDQQEKGESALLDPALNLLAKAPVKLIVDPPGAAWKERLAEVLSLTRTFRFAQAETKLRAILRDFPDQPGPLSHLLLAQCAQLNQSAAYQTARKLADHLEVSAEDRAYYAALALELEPEQRSLRPESAIRYCEIDSDDRITAALAPLENVEPIEGEAAEQLRHFYATLVNDEVPARRVYSVFDVPLKGSDEDSERKIATSMATIVVYGKQTDKPARVLLLATRFPAYQASLDALNEVLQLGNEMPGDKIPESTTYAEFLNRAKLIVGSGDALTIAESGSQLLEDFLNLPLRMFDGATPLEASKEERHRGLLLGLLGHLEGQQDLVVEAEVISEIYQRLDIERPAVKIDAQSGNLRLANILDLERIDISKLSDQHLKSLLLRAMSLGASRVVYRCSKVARERSGLAADAQIQVIALSALLQTAPQLEDKIAYCRELESTLAAAKAPVGRVVIQLVSLLHAAGRPDEAQQAMMDATTKYPEDPYLMSFLQYAMQSQRGGMPGGPGGIAAGPQQSSSDSGLVLPGQQASSSEGASKLWLPGS